ncbi:MAG: thioredoxin-dependent thiol peroxidase [Candidatus Saccharibacteria bacterium]|nr:thioredoxin-dependent thiol peroxidase [Candidatus Saccharibacteria bacterium]
MKAPNFSLTDQSGTRHNLGDYAGKWLVVYFYPKDDTPGCTKQACTFRDGRDLMTALGAEVVGISKDSARKHASFAAKHGLNFTLLSDPTAEVIDAYGSWKPKKMFGREFLGIHRDTYLINPEGDIVKKYDSVDPATNFQEVYADLKDLSAR